jgi:TetR/AcrR family transcriptional repressor of nem operon
MGRRKTYDRDEVVEQAMHMFWSNGYHQTSTRDLADAMGINVYSLYAEFGSKQGLYDAAVERYERDMVTRYIGALEQPDASLSTVRQVLRQYPGFARAEGGAPGCLLCNAAIEQAPTAAASQESTARYVGRLTAGISRALANSRATGSSDAELDAACESFGHYLSALLLGLFVMIRAKTSVGVLEDAVESAVREVDAFAQTHGLVDQAV